MHYLADWGRVLYAFRGYCVVDDLKVPENSIQRPLNLKIITDPLVILIPPVTEMMMIV